MTGLYKAIVGYPRCPIDGKTEPDAAAMLLEIVSDELVDEVAAEYRANWNNISIAESTQEEYYNWLFKCDPS